MSVILNKIDPVIVNNVHQQTVEGVVHTSDKTRVSKDAREKKNKYSSSKKDKEKIDKFNSLLESMGIDLSLILEGSTINIVDKDGKVVKVYNEDAVIELLNKMEDMIGIFLDTKK